MHCGKHRADPHASQRQLAFLTSTPGSGSETLTALIGRLCCLQASCWSRTAAARRVCLRTTSWAARRATAAPRSGRRWPPPRPAPWPCDPDQDGLHTPTPPTGQDGLHTPTPFPSSPLVWLVLGNIYRLLFLNLFINGLYFFDFLSESRCFGNQPSRTRLNESLLSLNQRLAPNSQHQSSLDFNSAHFISVSFNFFFHIKCVCSWVTSSWGGSRVFFVFLSHWINLICLNLKCIWTRLNISYLLSLCLISICAPEQPPCDCGGPVKFTDFQPHQGLLLHRFSLRLWNISSWRLWGEIWNHKQQRGARTVKKKKIKIPNHCSLLSSFPLKESTSEDINPLN